MNGLLIICAVLAILLVFSLWRFFFLVKHRRLLAGFAWSIQGLALTLVFFLVLLVLSNLYSYQRLPHETPIADVFIQRLAPQQFRVSLSMSKEEKDQLEFILDGDQWQLVARILKWKGWFSLLGQDGFYQLERISGRYRDIEQARQLPPSTHDLSRPVRGLDIFELKQLLRDKLSFVEAFYGQGEFMPMVDGAHYQVSIGQQGLFVRPANGAARQASL